MPDGLRGEVDVNEIFEFVGGLLEHTDFQRIHEITGISSLDDLVSTFIDTENKNFSMLTQANAESSMALRLLQ